jgi:hypothetical protein
MDQFLQYLRTIIEKRLYLVAAALFALFLLFLKTAGYLGSFADVSIIVNTLILVGGLAFFILLSEGIFAFRHPFIAAYRYGTRIIARKKAARVRAANFRDMSRMHVACFAYIEGTIRQQRFPAEAVNAILRSMVSFHLLEIDSPVAANAQVYYRVPDDIWLLLPERVARESLPNFDRPPWSRDQRI